VGSGNQGKFLKGEQHCKINDVGGTTWQCGVRTGLFSNTSLAGNAALSISLA